MKRAPLPLILLLALLLRATGLGFGLPNHEHAYSYNPDEWTPLQALKSMNPKQLDFNPHYFFNPTFHYYLYGAGIFAAGALGWINPRGSEKFYFDHPEHLARMILVGRTYSVVLGVLTVWLVYLLARRLGMGRGGAGLAALFMALHPSHVIHSHFMTVNVAVTFWSVITFLLLERWLRRRDATSAILVGLCSGLAASTKYSGALLLPFAGMAVVLAWIGTPSGRERRAATAGLLRHGGLMAGMAGLAFVAGTPYSVLAFGEFRRGFLEMGSYMDAASAVLPAARRLAADFARVGRVHLFASSPGLAAAGLAGLAFLVKPVKPLRLLVAAWIAAFFLISVREGALATDSRFLPIFPFVSISAALALVALHRAWPRTGSAIIAIVLVSLLIMDQAYVGRFVGSMPQQRASEWARTHLTGSETVRLAGSAIYFYPDLPQRERLQSENAASYPRQTRWTFVEGRGYADTRPRAPDVVFLTVWLPYKARETQWLTDPGYEIAATFPGKVHFFGRRIPVPLDLYDTDTWVVRRRVTPAG